MEKVTAPSPLSSLCRYRAPKPHPYGTGAKCFTQGAGGMVFSAVTSGRGAVRAYFPEAPSGCPKRSEGGFPATARRKYTKHHLQNKHKTTEERHPSANQETKKLNTKPRFRRTGVFLCARYWDRTSDLFRVREARYRCANRAHKTNVLLRGEDGIRTRVHGFAGRCLTTRPPHRIRSTRERVRTLGVLTSG